LSGHTKTVRPGRPNAGTALSAELYAAAISPDLRWAVTSGLDDEHIFVWDLEHGIKHKELVIPEMFTSRLAISPDSRLVAVSVRITQDHDAAKKNTITVWDLQEGRQLLALEPDPSELPNTISFSVDGKQLISASGTTSVILWDLSEAYAQLE
jgi:WD40 repeat protein